MTEPLLKVRNLKKHFPLESPIPFKKSSQSVKAVDGVSFDVIRGETLGVVGESGCGKSTMARLVNQLITPSDGTVEFKGENLIEMDSKRLREIRKSIQMVFQDPYAFIGSKKNDWGVNS